MAQIEAASPHTMNTYGRLPIALSHGRRLLRVGRRTASDYLDALAGIAVNTLGPQPPEARAGAAGPGRASSSTARNYYHVPNQEKLAAKLVRALGHDQRVLLLTGLEANEAAHQARAQVRPRQGIERPEIVVYEKAFHGRSIATLSATGNAKVQAGFGPLVEGFIRVPLNDIDGAASRSTDGNPNVVAVFFETIQGEGGINPMRIEYLQQVRAALRRSSDWLLMIDEVQCGMGRTGKWFAHQWAGIVPDVMPLAKGLGSGVPIGARGRRPEGRERLPAGQPRHHLRRQPAGHARRRRDDPHHGRGRPARERRRASART